MWFQNSFIFINEGKCNGTLYPIEGIAGTLQISLFHSPGEHSWIFTRVMTYAGTLQVLLNSPSDHSPLYADVMAYACTLQVLLNSPGKYFPLYAGDMTYACTLQVLLNSPGEHSPLYAGTMTNAGTLQVLLNFTWQALPALRMCHDLCRYSTGFTQFFLASTSCSTQVSWLMQVLYRYY